ncbi:SPOR domain-containing protein [Thermodesulfobacteriota bacterium]
MGYSNEVVGKTQEKMKNKDKRILMTFTLTRKSAAMWFCLFLIISGFMFMVGVFTGRRVAPLDLDAEKLENTLAALKEAEIKRKKGNMISDSFGFYDNLEGDRGDDNFKTEESKKRREHDVENKVTSKNAEVSIALDKTGAGVENKKTAQARLTLQVAAFKNRERADRMIDILKQKGYDAYRDTHKVSGNSTWYRVRIGSFKNREDAGSTLRMLQKDKIKAFLVQK